MSKFYIGSADANPRYMEDLLGSVFELVFSTLTLAGGAATGGLKGFGQVAESSTKMGGVGRQLGEAIGEMIDGPSESDFAQRLSWQTRLQQLTPELQELQMNSGADIDRAREGRDKRDTED